MQNIKSKRTRFIIDIISEKKMVLFRVKNEGGRNKVFFHGGKCYSTHVGERKVPELGGEIGG